MHHKSIRRSGSGTGRFRGGTGQRWTSWRRLSVLALALIILPLAFTASALAVPPTTEVTVIVNFTYTNTSICGSGSPIVFVENGSFKVKTYYDKAGNRVKSILTNAGPYGESATANRKTLTANYPAAYITFPNGTEALLGLRSAYHVPGIGLVLLNAGRIVFDSTTGDVLSQPGQHQVLDGDTGAFCAYFFA